MEEEGVPCRVLPSGPPAPVAAPGAASPVCEAPASAPADAALLAHAAACASPVSVGLGLSADGACLHLPQLPPGAPLLSVSLHDPDPERLRALGHNAARLVAGVPLKELP
nr:glycerol dehydratase reactivase beta/small subunit family protein [Conexibacter arvalis]